MKKTIYIILTFCLLGLFSCNKTVEDISYNGKFKIVKEYKLKRNNEKHLYKETAYYENQNIYYSGSYKNDLKEGEWTYYYDNGELWSKTFYKKGNEHGKKTCYHPNGKPSLKGEMDNGNKIGKWEFYDEDGNLSSEKDF